MSHPQPQEKHVQQKVAMQICPNCLFHLFFFLGLKFQCSAGSSISSTTSTLVEDRFIDRWSGRVSTCYCNLVGSWGWKDLSAWDVAGGWNYSVFLDVCMVFFISIWDGMTKIKIPNLRCLRHLLVLLELRWVGVHLTCFAGIETVGFRPPLKYHPGRRLQNSFDPYASTKLIRVVLSCNSRVSDLDSKDNSNVVEGMGDCWRRILYVLKSSKIIIQCNWFIFIPKAKTQITR